MDTAGKAIKCLEYLIALLPAMQGSIIPALAARCLATVQQQTSRDWTRDNVRLVVQLKMEVDIKWLCLLLTAIAGRSNSN